MFGRSTAEALFVDTNVLLYMVDERDARKRARALSWLTALWIRGRGRTSWQVLNEFYDNAVRKFGTDKARARGVCLEYAQWEPVPFSMPLLERAWHWTDTARISYWDALIVAAAEHSGARWLLTEDLQAGQSFDAVTIINPFTAMPEDFGFGTPVE